MICQPRAARDRRRAFTLVELLVVMAIIAVLVAMLLPAVQKVRESSNRTVCQNNLRQLGVALQHYHHLHQRLPAGGVSSNETSWHVYILPLLGEKNLFDQFNLTPGQYTSGVGRNDLAFNRLPQFLCPSSPVLQPQLTPPNQFFAAELISGLPPYTTHYYGVMGPKGTNPATGAPYGVRNVGAHGGFGTQGVFEADSKVSLSDISDGTSATFMVGELSWSDPVNGTRYSSWMRGTANSGNEWMAGCKNVVAPINTPGIATFNDISFGSQHPAGANFLFCDTSVRLIAKGVSLNVYKAAASRNGREPNAID